MKILLLGDTHASRGALETAYQAVQEHGLDAIFQVGDFGYWPRDIRGRDFLSVASHSPVPLYWLPGNHEDWWEYQAWLAESQYDADGFAMMNTMRISPKTHVWQWDNLRFAVVAGAYSVDRSTGQEGVTWFPEETPTFDQVRKLPDKVDVLLTHEAPINLARVHNWGPLPRHWDVDWELSNQSQNVIWSAVQQCQPGLLVHGHWHWRGTYQIPDANTTCIGLDQCSAPIQDSSMILDTVAGKAYSWYQFMYEPEGTGVWQAS